MMTSEQLKNSILQLAMEGKLVEQRLEEGTGEDLYQNIQIERGRLIKKGRIKKDKKFSDLITIEYPFDIPETWKWVKFGSVMNVVSARRVHQADWKSRGIPFYRAREIAKLAEAGYVENELFISEELYKEFSKSGAPEPGDLMVTGVGTLGKTYVVKEGDQFYYKDASVLCFENYARLNPYFIKRIMESPLMKGQIKSNSSGTTVVTLTMVRMMEYLIPLPPLAEQKRIVAKIEELMPFVEQYAVASTKLKTLNANFPVQMKKAILQEAVQGKLVPQDPNDEPASELLKKITQEKASLIKEGRIKKQKPLPEVTEDEIPFDIPESWEWIRLMDLCKSITDGDHQPPPQVPSGVPFLVISNVSSGQIDMSDTRYVPQEYFYSLSSDRVAEYGDILFTVTGSYGIPVVVDCKEQFCFQRHIALLKILCDRSYLYWVLKSPVIQSQCDVTATGTAQKTVGLKALRNMIVPVPPLAEQKRIVARIEELLSLCKQLDK